MVGFFALNAFWLSILNAPLMNSGKYIFSNTMIG